MDEALRLAVSANLPYTGLRDFEPDSRLWHYVPLPYAAAQRIVPVLLVGDTLKLATDRADPDLHPLSIRFPNLTLHIVIAPTREIDRILAHVQGLE